MKGNRTPEELCANLHRHVAGVVRVPDPDLAAVFDYALVGGGLDANSLEDSGGCLDLFAGLDLHGDGDGAHGVGQGEADGLADDQRLRGGVEDGRERVGDAGGNRGGLLLGGAFDQVLLHLGLLALFVVEGQIARNFAPALLQLLAEAGGAAGPCVEAGLEAVDDGEEHGDGAD